MTYVKKAYKRVKRFARKRYGGTRGIAKLARDVNNIRKMINVEYKYKDVSATGATISNAWASPIYINTIAQGDDAFERTGDSVKLRSIWQNINLNIHSSATNTHIRVVMFIAKDPDGTTPPTANIFTSASVLSPYNVLTGNEYQVIYDKHVLLTKQNYSSRMFNFTRRFNHHVKFIGTGSTVASAGKGTIFLTFICDEATNTPNIDYYFRQRYVDN